MCPCKLSSISNVFEMGFVVRSGVKSNDLHLRGFRRIGGKKQGNLIEFQSFQAFQSFQMFSSDS